MSGSVGYDGPVGAPIRVRAAGMGATFTAYATSIASPGPYQFTIDRPGAYVVSAFLDENTNGILDPGEPAGSHPGNPVTVSTAGQSISGVNISLGGAYAIAGTIAWPDGYAAWNIEVQLSGTAVATTTTDDNGNYVFAGLANGPYLISPVYAPGYFYPYDQSIDVFGSDVAGVDFEIHTIPTGDVDGDVTGTVLAVDPAGYNLTLDTGSGPLTLYVYPGTIYSGDASSLAGIGVGWTVIAQYYTSADLAVELDSQSGGL